MPWICSANLPKKRRTIPVNRINVTFFQLYIYHFPKHKSNLISISRKLDYEIHFADTVKQRILRYHKILYAKTYYTGLAPEKSNPFYHSTTAEAQVRPPPKPLMAIFMPGFNMPLRFISSSRIGTLAAEIFPQ